MSLIDELNQIVNDLPFNKHPSDRRKIAHFCEHDGITIRFTRARTTWLARTPGAVKPWWLFLEPLRKQQTDTFNNNSEHNRKHNNNDKAVTAIPATEVNENA